MAIRNLKEEDNFRYDMQYSRLDQNFSSTNVVGGLMDENLLTNNDKQSNAWMKSNKLTRSTSLFNGILFIIYFWFIHQFLVWFLF